MLETVPTPARAGHPQEAAMPDTVQVLPDDRFNQELVANVHPRDWVNPDPPGRYNLVVIGGGTAGLVSAAGAAGLGARVALIERELLGGDCLNFGCVPSKALIRASRAAAEVRGAAAYGVEVPPGVRVNFPEVMARMRRLRAGISGHDSAARFRGLGVDVYLGSARFTGSDTVEVAGKTLRFKKAVLATGARAERPSIPGLAEAGFLTNETVFSLTELPRRLAVVGAGPIGCELAQAFARLGSEVTLLGNHAQIMPREDSDAAAVVERAMRRDGVRLVLGCQVRAVEQQGGDKVIRLEAAECASELRVDEILVGVGRKPNVEGLDLEAAGVAYDPKEGVKVSDRLRTTNRRIFAAGDICSRFKFTHAADAMARIVIRNALFLGRARASALTIPWCTYTDPEIAHVGLSERQAQERGIVVTTFTQEMGDVDRAVLDGDTEGFVKIHVKKGGDKILGATVVARHAGEMISELTLAMVGGLGLGALAQTIHPYPTQAEAIKKAGDAYYRTRLTPFVKWLFGKWLSWTR
jgi:pyruvate/2-oxoglutarate dehydrogenase complex dihydrolipoamide dehydrogenase (E3) component